MDAIQADGIGTSRVAHHAGMISQARDHPVTANGLRLHLLEWGAGGPVVVLLHGFLEHAHVWDFTAPALAAAGYHVFALDWRGHGDSAWVGAGGYYHFADYTADLAAVVRAVGGRAALVGHSMGASAALIYTGTEPERVLALVAVDALGPPDMGAAAAPGRFAAWVGDLARMEERERVARVAGDPAARLRERFPRFPAEVAEHLAAWGTRSHGDGRAWKFDPLHQTASPQPFYVAQAREFWRRIACPVLYVDGADSPLRLDPGETAARLRELRARRATVARVGHHPHLEAPEEFVAVVRAFLEDVHPPGA